MDIRATLKPDVEIPWTAENIKNLLWRAVQEKYVGKKSTTELTTREINQVYEVLNRHLSDKFGLTVEFPHEERIDP